MDSLDGFLVINKSRGPSSFDIVRKLRKIFGIKKIGHHGTLDPMAEGVLVIAIGKATKLLNYLPDGKKCYEFKTVFGKSTDTLDSEGNFIEYSDRIPSKEEIEAVIPAFLGDVEQTPPQFSAVKVNGIPAYKSARNGKSVDIKPRVIHIDKLELLSFEKGVAKFCVECSRGTYVRVISTQIAERLGTCAYTSMINRTKSGIFTVESSVKISDSIQSSDIEIISTKNVFNHIYPSILVNEMQKKELSFGRDIEIDIQAEVIFLYSDDCDFPIAVARCRGGSKFHPEKVFV